MNRADLFDKLINVMVKAGINYAITGMTEGYPQNIGSDVDIVVPKSQLPLFHKVVWELEDDCTRVVQMFQHEVAAFYYIVIHNSHETLLFIQPDVCADYIRNDRLLLDAEYLLQDVVRAHHGDFKVLHPSKEFIYYLLKKIDKTHVSHEQFDHIRKSYLYSPESARKEMSSFWQEQKQQDLIADCLRKDDYRTFVENVFLLQKSIHRARRITLSYRIKGTLLKLKRITHPTGLVIAIMGPDGTGKSAVAEGLIKNMMPAFRKMKRFHLLPLIPRNDAQINTQPHNQKKRNALLSFIKLCYLVVVYQVGYICNVLPAKIRSTIIVFDRYYDDILVDPIRYRNGTSNKVVRLLRPLIPSPDIYLFIDSPTAVIQARKAEVSYQETDRQREAYIELAHSIKNSAIIENNSTIEEAVDKACLVVTKVLAERAAKRYKL